MFSQGAHGGRKDLLARFGLSSWARLLLVVTVVDVVVQDVLGGKVEAAVVALRPLKLAGSESLQVAVVGVRVVGGEGAQKCRTKL